MLFGGFFCVAVLPHRLLTLFKAISRPRQATRLVAVALIQAICGMLEVPEAREVTTLRPELLAFSVDPEAAGVTPLWVTR
jgi:hypothetical protein